MLAVCMWTSPPAGRVEGISLHASCLVVHLRWGNVLDVGNFRLTTGVL